MKIKIKDPVIKKVVKKFVKRSEVGYKKYGVTLRDDKSNMDEWLNHLQEELMDAVNYIERAREELAAPFPALQKAVDDYNQALENIDIINPMTYSYTGPEKLKELTAKCPSPNLDCTFCTCNKGRDHYL